MKTLQKTLLILFLALPTIYCSANPGAYAFITKNVINQLKSRYWSKMVPLFSKIAIPEGFSGSDFSAKNVLFHLNIDQNSVNLNLNEGSNSLTPQIDNIRLKGTANFSVSKFIFHFSGKLGITGTINKVAMTAKLTTTQKDSGQIPNISITNTVCSVNDNLDITIDDSVLKILQPVINGNLFGLKSWIIGQIQSAVTNGGIAGQLTKLANSEIVKQYPTQIPINDYKVSVSTYTTGGIKVYSTGIEVPLEGFTFPSSKGHTNYATCSPMENYIEHKDTSNDANAVVGDCLILSAVDALADTGITQKISVNKYGLGDIFVGFSKWDKSNVQFHPNGIDLKIGVYISTSYLGHDLAVTANVTANALITKKCGLKKVFWLDYGLSQKVKNSTTKYTGILEDSVLGTYTISAKITDATVVTTVGVWPITIDALFVILKSQTFGGDVSIPQFCITDGLCMGKLDFGVMEKYVLAHASLAAGQ